MGAELRVQPASFFCPHCDMVVQDLGLALRA